MSRFKNFTAIAGLTIAALALTSCAGADGDADAADDGPFSIYGHEVTENPEISAMLPDDVQSLTTTTDAAGQPRTFLDEKGDLQGVLPDLVGALGATLGLDIEVEVNPFDAHVPGVQSGRFDFSLDTGDFETRREVLDMIDYYKAGWVYLVAAGNPKDVSDDQLTQCGLRVGVHKGTTQETLARELSTQCVDEGLPAVDVQAMSNTLLAVPLKADRIDVAWENESAGMAAAAKEPEAFELAGDPVFAAYLGMGVNKDNSELRDALQAALQDLIDTGVYQAILDEWGVGDLAIDYASINSDVRE